MNKILATVAIAAIAFTASVASSQALTIIKKPTRGGSDYGTECSAQMGFLPHIYPAKVQAISSEQVVLEPICDNDSLYSSATLGSLFVDGNVTGLRKHIALNRTLVAALASGDYRADDVVGMKFGTDMVILYVHRR